MNNIHFCKLTGLMAFENHLGWKQIYLRELIINTLYMFGMKNNVPPFKDPVVFKEAEIIKSDYIKIIEDNGGILEDSYHDSSKNIICKDKECQEKIINALETYVIVRKLTK